MKKSHPITILGVILALFGLLLFGSSTTLADSYTGCVTPGGTVIHLALGDSPKEPCARNMKLIHLNNDKHNEDTLYNHLAVCTALGNAGAQQVDLDAMGCPKDPVVPDAYVIGTPNFTFFNNEPHEFCGLKLEKRPQWGSLWHIVVYGSDDYSWDESDDPPVKTNNGGGYLAYTTKVYSGDVSANPFDDCRVICEGDDKCIAARVTNTPNNVFEDCDVFHHNDQAMVPYNIFCGIQPGGGTGTFGSCEQSQTDHNHWFTKCPVVP